MTTASVVFDGVTFMEADFLGSGFYETVTLSNGDQFPRWTALMAAMQRDMAKALAAVTAAALVLPSDIAAQLAGVSLPYHVTATTTVGAKIAFAPAIPITVDADALLIIQADGLVVL